MLQKHICPPWCKIQVYLLCKSKICPKQGLKYMKWTTHKTKKSGLILTFEPENQWDHLLIGRNPCTKFGIDQVKGSKDIEWTTHWAQKSGLTLTFFKGGINIYQQPHHRITEYQRCYRKAASQSLNTIAIIVLYIDRAEDNKYSL